jgi:hypothetical protein
MERDTKLDDGKPTSGKFYAYKRTSTLMPNCATDDTVTATYDLTNTSATCYPLSHLIRA